MESYVAHHGHCRVLPHEVWDDLPLGEWIKTWRARCKRIGQEGSHDGRDLAWLADLPGWDPHPRRTRWWATYEAVRAAACLGETIDVAVAEAADPALYNFVNKQRSYYRKRQHLDRVPLLEQIDGWSWVGPGKGKLASAALPDKRRDRAASLGEAIAGEGLEGE